MGPSNISFLSFRAIFHFHDYRRKGTWVCPRNIEWCDNSAILKRSPKKSEKLPWEILRFTVEKIRLPQFTQIYCTCLCFIQYESLLKGIAAIPNHVATVESLFLHAKADLKPLHWDNKESKETVHRISYSKKKGETMRNLLNSYH